MNSSSPGNWKSQGSRGVRSAASTKKHKTWGDVEPGRGVTGRETRSHVALLYGGDNSPHWTVDPPSNTPVKGTCQVAQWHWISQILKRLNT